MSRGIVINNAACAARDHASPVVPTARQAWEWRVHYMVGQCQQEGVIISYDEANPLLQAATVEDWHRV